MAITVTISERQHWKNRISSKLDQRISSLRTSSPELLESITGQAKQIVESSLDLTSDFEHFASLDSDLKQLALEKENLLDAMGEKVFGKEMPYSISMRDIHSQIQNLQDEKAEEILLENPLGKQIADLVAEKENLLDSILLATSVPQIIELWDRVAILTADQPPIPEPQLVFTDYSFQH